MKLSAAWVAKHEAAGKTNSKEGAWSAIALLALLCWGAVVADAALVINEWVASNGIHADEDGASPDWIELYNSGTETVELEGYGLTDQPGNRFRWVFPGRQLAAGEFLLIWASGKDRRSQEGALHANFSLSSSGEPLILSRPDGVVADAVTAIRLGRNQSYGRQPDGTANWAYFSEPTPAASNRATAYAARMEPPEFSHSAGFYPEAIELQLSSTDPGASILYTLDGSEPAVAAGVVTFNYKNSYPGLGSTSTGSLLSGSQETRAYTGAITLQDRTPEPNRLSRISSTAESYPPGYLPSASTRIRKATVVRARVVRDGALPSEIITRTYWIGNDESWPPTLPVVALTLPEESLFGYAQGIYTAGQAYDEWWLNHPGERNRALWQRPANYTQRGDDWERAGHFEWFSADGELLLAQNIGIRTHGGASRSYPQKSLRAYARRAYDEQNSFRHPMFADPPLDPYGRTIQWQRRLILRNSGNDLPNSRFRDSFIQTLMRPLGLDDQRHQPAAQFINGEFWGIINIRERIDHHYLAARHALDAEDIQLLTARTALLLNGDEEPEDPDAEADFATLHQFIEENDMADNAHYASAAQQMDMDSFIRFNVAHIFADNRDWPHNNNRYWRKRTPDPRPGALPQHDGRWRWILNDLDFGYGLYGGADNASFNTIAHATNPNPNPGWDGTDRSFATVMLRNLLLNRDFRERFINTLYDHIATTFQPQRAHAVIDQMNASVAPLRDGEHRTRWGSMMQSNNHVTILKEFATRRPAAVINHIRSHFTLPPFPLAEMTFTVSDPAAGYLRVNSLELAATDAAQHAVFPFIARYNPAIPINVSAIAHDGFRFSHWAEHAGGSNLKLSPRAGSSVTAVFVPAPENQIIAYWNFNTPGQLEVPELQRTAVAMHWNVGPQSGFTDGGGNGFSAANARGGDPAGRHLRINSPVGASIVLRLPTSGFSAPVLIYETRRSADGCARQIIETSSDGSHFTEFAEIRVFDEDPIRHQFDFAALDDVADNPHFHVRIRFLQGDGGTAGNVRIDNLVIHATPLAPQPDATPVHYSVWRWLAFPDPTERANPQLSAPLAAPFGDSFSNLLRYAFNLLPCDTTSQPVPLIRFDQGNTYLQVPAVSNKYDIAVRAEYSHDLQSWLPHPADSIQPGDPLQLIRLNPRSGPAVYHRIVVLPLGN